MADRRVSVAESLVEFGRELEAAGAAQVGESFSGNPQADELIESSANAFLLGVLFTQGIAAERAWSGPWLLQQRLGTLDPSYLAEHADKVREAVARRPMLHRFKNNLPRWIIAAGERLADEYEGDASRIWPEGAHVLEVIERLSAFEGIGRKKAVMAVEILTRHFGVSLEGRDSGQVAFDVHVRRVFMRSGLVDVDERTAVERAAAVAYPESPGLLDLPTWLIGRQWCTPRAPKCGECRLSDVCPRLVDRNVVGVGSGRRRSG